MTERLKSKRNEKHAHETKTNAHIHTNPLNRPTSQRKGGKF